MESTIVAVECGPPSLSLIWILSYLFCKWIGVFVKDLRAFPVDDMVPLCNVVCYGGLVELTCRLLSVCSGEFIFLWLCFQLPFCVLLVAPHKSYIGDRSRQCKIYGMS